MGDILFSNQIKSLPKELVTSVRALRVVGNSLGGKDPLELSQIKFYYKDLKDLTPGIPDQKPTRNLGPGTYTAMGAACPQF